MTIPSATTARSVPGFSALLAAGAMLLALLAQIVGSAQDPSRAFANLLLDSFYFLSLSLGAVFFLAVLYLTEAGWFVAIRRVPEALGTFVPVAGGLMLLVFLGRGHLYAWTRPEAALDPLLQEKAAYLSSGGFFVRLVLAGVLWTFFALYLRRISLTQDSSGDGLAERRQLKRLSAIFVPIFAVTFSLESFDWLMSLEPHWYSTMFAVYAFAGLFLGAIAAITVGVVLLRERGPLAEIVTDDHLHDLGKMLFAFSTFWAYIWVSQYLLIWYGNLPEEITHYQVRTQGPWLGLFALNVVLNWGIPFLVLMGRRAKRSPRVLVAVAVVVLAGHWLDLDLLIRPALAPRDPGLGWLELLTFAGYLGFFFLVVQCSLSVSPAVPQGDPLLDSAP